MYWYFHIVSGSGRAKRRICTVYAREPGQMQNVESGMQRRKISTEGEKGLILTTAQDAGSPWVERKHGARSMGHGTRNANINTGSQGVHMRRTRSAARGGRVHSMLMMPRGRER